MKHLDEILTPAQTMSVTKGLRSGQKAYRGSIFKGGWAWYGLLDVFNSKKPLDAIYQSVPNDLLHSMRKINFAGFPLRESCVFNALLWDDGMWTHSWEV